jgi:hypothetical protein
MILPTGSGSIDITYTQGDPNTWAQYILTKTGVVLNVERFGPMLFRSDPTTPDEPANGRCGNITYAAVTDESPVQVTWSDDQLNPLSPSTDPLKFSLYTSLSATFGVHSFTIKATPTIKTYSSQKFEFKYEVLPMTYCGLKFVKTSVQPTYYKYYLQPYNTLPSDLVNWGSEIVAPVPETTTFCPQNPVIYKITSTRLNLDTGEDLVKSNCV